MKPDYRASLQARRLGMTASAADHVGPRRGAMAIFSYFSYYGMQTFDATTAKNQFGRLLDACANAPVAIERHGRVVAYVLGAGQMPQAQAFDASLNARLAQRLGASGAVYATVFGSLARGAAREDSDIDVAVSFGRPMSSDLRMAMIGLIADEARRAVDLVDLETAGPLILARALAGQEISCDTHATRLRMAAKLQRTEDARLTAARAAASARAGLFA